MKRLYRSREERMVGGVCGGLGQYLGIDPTLVRLFFVIFLVFKGFGFLIYMALWIVVPEAKEGEEYSIETSDFFENQDTVKLVGAGLVLFGLFALFDNLNFSWLSWISFSTLWPFILIVGGIALLIKISKDGVDDE